MHNNSHFKLQPMTKLYELILLFIRICTRSKYTFRHIHSFFVCCWGCCRCYAGISVNSAHLWVVDMLIPISVLLVSTLSHRQNSLLPLSTEFYLDQAIRKLSECIFALRFTLFTWIGFTYVKCNISVIWKSKLNLRNFLSSFSFYNLMVTIAVKQNDLLQQQRAK